MTQDLIRTALDPLLRRERQVLAGVRSGLSNRQIAGQINVCEDTVKYHLKRIFIKLGVRRRSEAVAVAVYNGLLDGFDTGPQDAAPLLQEGGPALQEGGPALQEGGSALQEGGSALQADC